MKLSTENYPKQRERHGLHLDPYGLFVTVSLTASIFRRLNMAISKKLLVKTQRIFSMPPEINTESSTGIPESMARDASCFYVLMFVVL